MDRKMVSEALGHIDESYIIEALELSGGAYAHGKENENMKTVCVITGGGSGMGLAAAKCIADTFEAGGLLQAFGSGHSNAGARELCHRAGGFVPTKAIQEPAGGLYESVNGVGEIFMKKVDIRKEDVVFIISNSGRNPLPIEIATQAKERGAKVLIDGENIDISALI